MGTHFLSFLQNTSRTKLFLVGLLSRLALLLLMALCDWVVPDYDTCSVLQWQLPVDKSSSTAPSSAGVESTTGSPPMRSSSSLRAQQEAHEAQWWKSSWFPFVNHWDGVHYQHIGRYGYTHENLCAFFPLLTAGVIGAYGGWFSQLPEVFSAVLPSATLFASLLSMVAYALSCVLLRELTIAYQMREKDRVVGGRPAAVDVTGSTHHPTASQCQSTADSSTGSSSSSEVHHCPQLGSQHSKFVGGALLFFLLTPSAAFTVVAYTEGLFSFLSFLGMWLLLPSAPPCPPGAGGAGGGGGGVTHSWGYTLGAVLSFTLATTLRSNGILLAGFLLYPLAVKVRVVPLAVRILSSVFLDINSSSSHNPSASGGNTKGVNLVNILGDAVLRVFGTASTLAPYFAFNYWCHSRFCSQSARQSTPSLLSSLPAATIGPLAQESAIVDCPLNWRAMYAYIQRKYWGVGWFTYYTVNNIPNFGIAAPMYFFVGYSLWKTGQEEAERSAAAKVGLQLNRSPAAAAATECEVTDSRKRFTAEARSRKRVVGHLLIRICTNEQLAYLCIMLLLALTRMHVQVVTRFVMSSPMVYWLFAELVVLDLKPPTGQPLPGSAAGRRGGRLALSLVCYVCCWMFLSCAMFANFFPWT